MFICGGTGRLLGAALCAALLAVPISAGPGFGLMRKKTVQLRTRQPAAIRLSDTSIAFTGGATNPEYMPIEASLLETLETELLKDEKTLVKKNTAAEAEWTLNAKVTGYSLPPPQQRTQGTGNTAVQYTHWVGTLNVAYQVLDKTGKTHDAQNVRADFDKEYDSSGTSGGKIFSMPTHIPFGGRKSSDGSSAEKTKQPRTTEDVKQILIQEAVGQIAANLGNTSRVLDVQVATGEDHLNKAATFMDDKLWSRALDLLDSTPAFPKPEDESYRQYDLGLVYEALSYDSKDAMDQRQNIYKAAEYYDKALELNPKEKYFVDSVARGKDSISRYKALDEEAALAKKTGKGAVAGESKPGGGKTPVNAAPPAKVFTASDAIELFSNGVGEDQITDMIRNSAVQFDPHDKDTVLAMAKAKLPMTIQNELRKKVGAPPLGTNAASSRAVAVHKAAPKAQQ